MEGLRLPDRDTDDAFDHRLVAVEYQDGRPVLATVQHRWNHGRKPWYRKGTPATGFAYDDFQFEFCRRDDALYFHHIGLGSGPADEYHVARFVHPRPPKAQLWLADGVKAVTWVSKRRPKVEVSDAGLLRRGYERIAAPLTLTAPFGPPTRDPFAAARECDNIVYCPRCRDWLPDESDEPCEHIWWCDRCGHQSAPGSRCGHRRSSRAG